MRATSFLLTCLIVVCGCAAPGPTPSPPTSAVVATTSPVASASPSATITDQVGDVRFERPSAWITTHPAESVVPGVFLALSTVPLTTPCSMPVYGPMACLPGGAIPDGGVLIWFASGAMAVAPAATAMPLATGSDLACTAAGGHVLTTRLLATYIGACLRGSTADAAFLAFFGSLRGVKPGSSTAPAVLPICQTSQLAITTTNSSAAAGTVGVYLRFANRGSEACTLLGWPAVVGVTASGAATMARDDFVGLLPFPDLPIQTVVLNPGADAFSSLGGGDNPGGSEPGATCPPSYHTLGVTPPGNTESVVLSGFDAWLGHDLTACAGLVESPIVSAAQMAGFVVYPLRP